MTADRIRAGDFDGAPRSPTELAVALVHAQRADLPDRKHLDDALREHVGANLRSGDRRRIDIALAYVDAMARMGASVAATLVHDADAALASAEWKAWSDRDPEAAAAAKAEADTVIGEAWRTIARGTCGAG